MQVSDDGRYLILTISSGCEPTNRLWALDLAVVPRDSRTGALDFSELDFQTGSRTLPVIKLADDFTAAWGYIGSSADGTQWTLLTNLDAPRYRVVRLDLAASPLAPPEQWESVIEQHPKDLLQWCALLAGGVMAACYLSDVKSQLQLCDFASGAVIEALSMPGIGSVGGFSGNHKSSEFFFSFTGFTEPGAQYRCDASQPGLKPTLFRRVATKFDPELFSTRQVFVPSRDGTRIPMFLVHGRDYVPTGNSPTLLYGYGGFNISLEPSYSVSRVAWLLGYGGVLAVANLRWAWSSGGTLDAAKCITCTASMIPEADVEVFICRGGGEYGIEWRNAGSLGSKQNTFDDFQACAEYLHREQYCSPATLCIQGGSNGGLLVAACVNQRPDLFAVALAQVGVVDFKGAVNAANGCLQRHIFALFWQYHMWPEYLRCYLQVGVMDSLRFKHFTIGHAWVTDYGDVDEEEHFNYIIPYSPLHNVARPLNGQYPAMLLTTGSHDDRVVPLHR